MDFVGAMIALSGIFIVSRYALNILSEINDSIEPKGEDQHEREREGL